MTPIGNAWLADYFDLRHVPLHRRSFVSTLASERLDQDHNVVERVFPKVYGVEDAPLEHVSFALKHEVPSFELLQHVFHKLGGDTVAAFVTARPTSQYTRQIGFFYEFLTGHRLALGSTVMAGNYVPLLDPTRLVTTAGKKVPRWRVEDNLLGSREFCPTVRLTKKIEGGLARRWKDEIAEVLKDTPPDTLKRALGYLYAKETKSSFLIEREEPGPDRTARFISALREAGRTQASEALTEKRMVTLQNTIVDPRYAQTGYRTYQNYVGETLPGLNERVHYVCPPPQFVGSLMNGLAECMGKMETAPAIVQASVTAFHFVFIHPFEDGNGRIHRFLFHDVLARRGLLSDGVVLPLSAAMLEDMKRYDAALEAFSGPLLSRVRYELAENGSMTVLNPEAVESAWRFPDLTTQVEYLGLVMDQALKQLPAELRFLERYDEACRAAREIVDIPDKRLRLLMNLLHQNGGRLARAKRSHFSELKDEEVGRIEKQFAAAFRTNDAGTEGPKNSGDHGENESPGSTLGV